MFRRPYEMTVVPYTEFKDELPRQCANCAWPYKDKDGFKCGHEMFGNERALRGDFMASESMNDILFSTAEINRCPIFERRY